MTRLIERLLAKNEDGSLVEITEEEQRKAAEVMEQQAKQIEELAAALAVKDVFIKQIVEEAPYPSNILVLGNKALSLQPHASLVAKIKADAVRAAASEAITTVEVQGGELFLRFRTIADRIERGEVN